MIIRSAQVSADPEAEPGVSGAHGDVSVQAQAAAAFADEIAVGSVPSVRTIRARLHVGQPRAQRVRAHLTALSNP
jgi:hypothetical protein